MINQPLPPNRICTRLKVQRELYLQGSVATYLLGLNKYLIKLFARNKPLIASNFDASFSLF